MRRIAITIIVVALTACSGVPRSGATLPVTPMDQGSRPSRSSWINAASTGGALLYVSSFNATTDQDGTVLIYSYPRLSHVGTLGPFQIPSGLCSDTLGNVYITDFGAATITEFAHGATTPTLTLHEDASPSDCAVDSSTGDLAVANLCGRSNSTNCAGDGSLLIFDRKGHKRRKIATPGMNLDYCGYDPHGFLYVDGNGLGLDVLNKRSKKLQAIALDRSIDTPGSIQWDGAHMTLEDQDTGRQPNTAYIYRLKISDFKATTVGTTTLSAPTSVDSGFNASWIQGNSVITTILTDNFPVSVGAVYAYPAGGSQRAGFGGLNEADGVTVSVARP